MLKMKALQGLKLVFSADVNPVYAGFGNSVSDMMAFAKASICISTTIIMLLLAVNGIASCDSPQHTVFSLH